MVVKSKSYIAHAVFMLAITYAMSSFTVLGLAMGILPFLPMASLDLSVCTIYTLISFVLAAGLSAYHLSSMVRGNKRWTDKAEKNT
jgi:hypothetical protein